MTTHRATHLACVLCAALCLAAASAPAATDPSGPAPDGCEPAQAQFEIVSGTISFGTVSPLDTPEAISSAAQLVVFSPTGDCFVGVIARDASRAPALVPTGGEGWEPPTGDADATSVPVTWELRWRVPGALWAEWALALPADATGDAPPGLWWRVGTVGATIPCDVELRCRAAFPLLSPPGPYGLDQPVNAAVWMDPVPY